MIMPWSDAFGEDYFGNMRATDALLQQVHKVKELK